MRARKTAALGALILGYGLLSGLVGPAPVLPNTIVIVSGEGQVGASGQVLADPIVFQVKDSGGNPVAGVKVTVTIGTGGAFLVPNHAVSTIDTVAGGEFGFGDGIPATDAFLADPVDVAADGEGVLFIADRGTGTIRRVDPVTGAISTVTGAGFDPFVADGQQASTVTGLMPRSVEIGKATQDLIFVDEASARVFRIDLASGAIFLVAGGGASTADGVPASSALLPAPVDASEDYAGNVYIAADPSTIRRVDVSTGLIATVLGGLDVRGLEVHRDGARLSIADSMGYLLADPVTTATDLFPVGAASGVTVDVDGSQFYSLDAHEIEMLADGAVPADAPLPIAGTGTAGGSGDGGPSTSAELDTPSGLAVDPFGNVYVADRINGRLRKITFALKEVSEFTHYSDAGGFVTTYPIKVITDPEVEATEEGTGQSTSTAVEMVGEPGGAPAEPDPNQSERAATNIEALKFPRWTPMTSLFRTRAPLDPGGEAAGLPSGSSHKRIALDAHNIVHVVHDAADEFFGDLPASGSAVWYFANRWETRKANGWSKGFDVSETSDLPIEDVGGIEQPSIVVDAENDDVHVVWTEGKPGDEFTDVYHRRLRQDPMNPGWDPIEKLTTGSGVSCPGVTSFGNPHLASDPVGGIHLVLTKTVSTTTIVLCGEPPEPACVETKRETFILYAKDVLTALAPVATAVAEITGDPCVDGLVGMQVGQAQVEAGPDGIGQITYVEQQITALEIQSQQKYLKIGGAAQSLGLPDQFINDFGVDGANVPHFVRSFNLTVPPFITKLMYRKDVAGIEELVAEGSNLIGGGIEVEDNGQPHILYARTEGPTSIPAQEFISFAPAYATREPDDPVGSDFDRQDSIDEQLTDTQSERVFGVPISMTVSRTGVVHYLARPPLITDAQPDQDLFYSRMVEPNLGEQDSFLMFGMGSAVNVGNGNYTKSIPIFSSRGVGFATNFSLVYNSGEQDRSVLSPGWQHNYHLSLTEHAGTTAPYLTLQMGDGRAVVFERRLGNLYLADPEYGYFSKLVRTPGALTSPPSQYVLTTKFGVEYTFGADGKLLKIEDTQPTPNTMSFTYEGNPNSSIAEKIVTGLGAGEEAERVLTKITDSAGRETTLTYGNRNNITQIQDPDNTSYTLDYTPQGRLEMVNFPLGVTWSMTYSSENEKETFERFGFLRTIATPRGTAEAYEWTLKYYPDNRMAACVDPTETHATEAASSAGAPPPTESVATARVITYHDPAPGTTSPLGGPTAFFVDRRNVTTSVLYERRRNLAKKIADPFSNPIDRVFFGTPDGADGFRNLESFTDKGSKKIGGAVTRNTTTYTYHPASPIEGGDAIVRDNLATITRPGVPAISYAYTSKLNRVASVTDSRGNTTRYFYDEQGEGVATAGNLTKIRYPATTDLRAEFSTASGLVTATPQAGSAEEIFTYDDKGRVKTHKTPNTGVTSFEYTNPAHGLVTEIKRPDHTAPEKFTYDTIGNTETHQMPEGGITTFVLDALYRVDKQIEPSGDILNPTTDFDYNLDSSVTQVTDPRGFVTGHDYDKLGRLTTTTNAKLDTMTFVYDRGGNSRSTTDFRGITSGGDVDKLGRTSKSLRPGPPTMQGQVLYDAAGNVDKTIEGTASRTTEHFYDARHNVVKTTHALTNLVDETVYDDNDNVIFSIRRDGGAFKFGSKTVLDARNRVTKTTQLKADPGGSPTEATPGVGDTTEISYDRDNNRTRVIDADGLVTTMAQDLADRQVATADGLGVTVSAVAYNDNDLRRFAFVQPPAGVTGTGPGGMLLSREMVYNDRNELKQTLDALGQSTTNIFDAAGNLRKSLDEDGGLTEFDYDELGRMTEQRQHVGDGGLTILKTIFGFDQNGNRTSITDPRGKIYAFQFDDANRMKLMTTPLGFTETWTYTQFGEVFVHTDANGKTATNEYDDQGRLTIETHVRAAVTIADVRRAYDGASNLSDIHDIVSGIRIHNTYTAKNELETTDWFLNATGLPFMGGDSFRGLGYTYFENGNRKTMTGPDGETTAYFYDPDNRIERIVRDADGAGPATPVLFVRILYDDQGRRRELQYVNGPDDPGTPPVAVTKWTYTAREEIETVTSTQGAAGPVIASYGYTYDNRGNRETMTAPHLGTSVTYQYLPVVNWLKNETWTGTVSHSLGLTYDEAGNRKTHAKVTAGVTESCVYTIDDDNRLLLQTLSAETSGGGGGGPVQFFGTPTADSTQPGRDPAVIVDGVTDNSTSAPKAWWNKVTGPGAPGPHFAGILFAESQTVDKLVVYIPTASQGNGNAASTGIGEFRLQALVGGVWTDMSVSSIAGATAHPTVTGAFATVDPTEHVITAEVSPVAADGVRLLMAAGGGSPAQPNRLSINEIEAFGTQAGGGVITENRLIEWGYDPQGNATSRKATVNAALVSVEAFAVDYMNRISAYTREDGLGNTQASFAYLFTPTGERLCVADLLAATAEWSMYDGADAIADYATSVGGTSFIKTQSYVQSLAIDSKHVRIDASGAVSYYIPDALGSVGVRIDASGTVIDTRITNAWGENLTTPGSDRYGFTGREAQPELVLPFAGATPAMHYRARTYFPEIGRFGQRDPAERTSRCYKYVENRPTGAIDPTGLQEKSVEKWMRWIERHYRKVSASPDLNTVWQRVWIKQLDMDRDDDTWYDCVDDFTNILEAFYELYVIGNKESDTSPHFADWPQLAVDASRDNSLATHFFLGASYGEFGRVISEAAELGDPKNHPDTRADMAAGYLGAYLGWYVTQIGDTNCRKIAKLFAAGTVKFEDLLGPPTDLVNIRAGNLDSDRWARKRAFEDLPDLFGTPKISGIGFGPGISDDAGFPNWQF